MWRDPNCRSGMTTVNFTRQNFQMHFFLGALRIKKKNSFRDTVRVSKGLDPNQVQGSVGPDLDPNCLEMDISRQQVTDSKERVKAL